MIDKIFGNGVNLVFILTMVGLFVFAIIGIYQSEKNSSFYRFAKSTPTLLTSVGILGTFVGIVIALMGFDDSNIKAHINEIIAGMQTAFITSVFGVFFFYCVKNHYFIG